MSSTGFRARQKEVKGFFPSGSGVKNSPAMQEMQETGFQSLGGEDALEEGMAIHSSILTWRILWAERSSRLQSIGSQRVRPELAHKYTRTTHNSYWFTG